MYIPTMTRIQSHWVWISLQPVRQGPTKTGVKPERRCEQGRNIEQCCDYQCSCLVKWVKWKRVTRVLSGKEHGVPK